MLNAFRHHGDERPGTLGGTCACASCVLNAFRHHGDERVPRDPRLAAEVSVLNAFRHHGDERRFVEVPEQIQIWCSTPSGITATNAFGFCDALAEPHECSTPSGITATNARARSAVRARALRACSTPSGITATNATPAGPTSSEAFGCSTPSGITATNAGSALERAEDLVTVLNAFRHHGDERISPS